MEHDNETGMCSSICKRWYTQNVGGIRYEARSRGCSSPDFLAFLSLRNITQTIEPTTKWKNGVFHYTSFDELFMRRHIHVFAAEKERHIDY